MRTKKRMMAASAALALAGCMADGAPQTTAAPAPGASAEVRDAGGAVKATATMTQTADGIALHVAATGMAPGSYGIHVHAAGRCEAPGFTSAGAHWNPAGKQHGRDNPMGMHLGDLPNLTIGADGGGMLDATIAGGRMTDGATPLLDADGAAIVIHAAGDDYRTDPSGNSGARVACGVIHPR